MLFENVSYLPEPVVPSPDAQFEQSTAFNILNLLVPKTISENTSLLVLIHGGAWRSNKPSDFTCIASSFVDRGLGVAVVGYRLSTLSSTDPNSPVSKITHPDHVNDVANGVAWILAQCLEATECQNIGSLDSDTFTNARDLIKAWNPMNIYIFGHSAGAHIASFLSLNANLIQAPLSVHIPTNTPAISTWLPRIKGYIGAEGIYNIPNLVRKFPSYKNWFIVAAFGHESDGGWKRGSPGLMEEVAPSLSWQVNKFGRVAAWLVVHSRDDELVDVGQSLGWMQALQGLRAKEGITPDKWVLDDLSDFVSGKHEDVIRSDTFFDMVFEWIMKLNK